MHFIHRTDESQGLGKFYRREQAGFLVLSIESTAHYCLGSKTAKKVTLPKGSSWKLEHGARYDHGLCRFQHDPIRIPIRCLHNMAYLETVPISITMYYASRHDLHIAELFLCEVY